MIRRILHILRGGLRGRILPGWGAFVLAVLVGGAVPTLGVAQPLTVAPEALATTPSDRLAAEPFPLSQVHITGGPFREALERDADYLLRLRPDRFLHNFRDLAGLEPKAPRYGGWESMQIAGHSLGHYLSALSLYYAKRGGSTLDQQLRGYRVEERIDYIVDELSTAQDARGTGYVGGIPEQDALWGEIANGTVEGEAFHLNGVWVPWYTLHKLFAGLIDAYAYTGNETALHVVTDLADWAIATTNGLSPAQWQEMLDTEHGGMNESLANLYALTGEQKYLRLSRKFHHGDVLTPLANDTARLEGLHANTQIPKVIGAARQYELTGADSLRTIAEGFWERVVDHHTYVIGGNTEGEHFGPRDTLSTRLGTTTAETCNTYNMLKLTRHLFSLSPAPRYAGYYERALYNHILASQEPERGMTTYFMSLKPGHFKTYATPDSSFWCCTGSGMENHVRYGQGIYFRENDDLYVNLFIPSALSWEEQEVTVRQHTQFPKENTTRLTFEMDAPTELGLRLRNPEWTAGPPTVQVNGQTVTPNASTDGYLTVRRTWTSTDTVEVTLPMALRTERMPDDSDRVAVVYGPVVLAGELGTEGVPAGGAFAKDHLAYTGADLFIPDSLRDKAQPYTMNTPSVPSLEAESDRVAEWLTPVEDDPLTFRTYGVGLEENLTFRPFYDTHHQRYSVYWTLTDPAGAD
jgi:DUF1680 family protein